MCDDNNCIFKYKAQKGAMRGKCKLTVHVAAGIYDNYGFTTCEFGCSEVDLDTKTHKKILNEILQMAWEDKHDVML